MSRVDANQLRGVQGLAAIQSPDASAALTAATGVARDLVPREYWSADIYVASPEGARWTIEEIGQHLLYQQAYAPLGDLRVVIVDRAHLMDARTHDHLLKTVEEPASTVLFLFTVQDASTLPTTIQSRIYRTVTVPSRTDAEMAESIRAAAGAAPSKRVLELARRSPGLSVGLDGENAAEVLPLCEELAALTPSFTSAFRGARLLEKIGAGAAGAKQTSPQAKALTRDVLRTFLALKVEEGAAAMADPSRDAALAGQGQHDRAVRARTMLDVNIPAEQVLASAFVEVPDAR